MISLFAMAACRGDLPANTPVDVMGQPPQQSRLPDEIQQAAEVVSFRAIEQAYPNVNAAPVANCVRANASDAELLALSDNALHELTASNRALVAGIVARDTTSGCIIDNGVDLG